MSGPLLQVSVLIDETAEEAVAPIFETLFGKSPSVYTDAETHATSATVFLDDAQEWNRETKSQFIKRLTGLRGLGIDIGSGKLIVRKLRREDWAESWKKHFKPIQIGKSLLIKPSWSKRRPARGQARVVLDPGLSFGTGQHATTSFCLQQIVRCRKRNQTQSLLDIGTGSGILAISAAKLGYSSVSAFDFDPESVRVSRENAEQNGVAAEVHPVRRDLTKLPSQSKTKFDVVCANLIYDVLLSEREKIVNRVKPAGCLILAGILSSQFAKVRSAYEKSGMQMVASKKEKEWESGRFEFIC